MAKKMENEKTDAGLTADVYLEHRQRCGAAEEAANEATNLRLAAFKRAKKAGVDVKAMATVMKLGKQNQNTVAIEQETIRRYAQWEKQAWATQGNLFAPDDQQPSEKASRAFELSTIEDEGRNASRNGHGRDTNKYDQGTEECAAFDNGWMAHQRVLADQMKANDDVPKPPKSIGGRKGKGNPLELVKS